jgi:hypothetical protein
LDQFEITIIQNKIIKLPRSEFGRRSESGKLFWIRPGQKVSDPTGFRILTNAMWFSLYKFIFHETEKPSSPLYLLMSARSCLSSCVRSGKVAARLPSSLTDIFIMASVSQQHTSKNKQGYKTPVLAFINPVLSSKTSIFVKNSLKCSFSFQTLLRDIGISLFEGSFSVKTLWQGSLNFLHQIEDFGLVQSKTR